MSEAISAIAFGKTQVLTAQDLPASTNTFLRAVVLHTLNDPALRDVNADSGLISTLRNKQHYMRAPRNSIICRILNDRKGLVENDDIICFPFFSSHFMLPVKAGEQVWIFMESSDKLYWISRISEPLHVEDANFTHGERRINREFLGPIDASTSLPVNDSSGNFSNPRKMNFQNGDPAQPELSAISGNDDAFLVVITGSKEYKVTSLEPVPRLTKRPGDLVFQGSNNTAIRLGTDMGWNAADRPTSSVVGSQASTLSNKNQLETGLGAIDIVVGRGRYFQDAATEKSASGKKSGSSQKNTTRPYIEETVLPGVFETDKNVGTIQDDAVSNSKGNSKTNPSEGDPDFLMDASRVYVSNKSEIDKALGTGLNGTAKHFETAISDKTGAAIAVKSDHVRIVARKSQLGNRSSIEPSDIGNENPPANGSIRIVKEGDPNSDLASITIESDGTIHISGSKIFIGRKSDDGGAGDGPGPGKSQPYVKYQQLDDLLNKTFDSVINFATQLQANFLANTTPGFGGPNPSLIKSANDECQKLIDEMFKRKNEIIKLKSKRIFGE